MNVMTVSPVSPKPVEQNEELRVIEEWVDIPQHQDAEPTTEPSGEGSPETAAQTEDKTETEEKPETEEKDEKKTSRSPSGRVLRGKPPAPRRLSS